MPGITIGNDFHDTQSEGVEHPVARTAQLEQWVFKNVANDTSVKVCDLANIALPAIFLALAEGDDPECCMAMFLVSDDGDSTYTCQITPLVTVDGTATWTGGAAVPADSDFGLWVAATGNDDLYVSNYSNSVADIALTRLM